MSSKKKIFLISSIIFLVIGTIVFITGFYLSGYDIIGWFSSRYAMYVYILIAFYAIVIISILVWSKVHSDM